jgi:hypothetical protein
VEAEQQAKRELLVPPHGSKTDGVFRQGGHAC